MQKTAPARRGQDARAAAAVERHHAELAAALAARVTALVDAAAHRDDQGAHDARTALVAWLHAELIPHAIAEESSLYLPAQRRPEGRLLVDGMLADHRRIVALVDSLEHETDPVRSAATGYALQTLFDGHLAKENELVLPLLLADPEVSVADLLAGMHALLGPGGHTDR
jgi:hypothetical protein